MIYFILFILSTLVIYTLATMIRGLRSDPYVPDDPYLSSFYLPTYTDTEKIMTIIDANGQATEEDIKEVLGISAKKAREYVHRLKDEGKLTEITGDKKTFYIFKQKGNSVRKGVPEENPESDG